MICAVPPMVAQLSRFYGWKITDGRAAIRDLRFGRSPMERSYREFTIGMSPMVAQLYRIYDWSVTDGSPAIERGEQIQHVGGAGTALGRLQYAC